MPSSKLIATLTILLTTLLCQTPARAETAADIGQLFNRVNNVAQELQANLSDLEASIDASRDSVEKGAEVLDAMLASVKKVHETMAEDSEIWQELDAVLELWEQRRQETLQKSESNPAFLPIANAWQNKLETARLLRNQISTERANSTALIRSIESDRDIVLAYYELGQADQAIASLRKVSSNLSNLNANMQKIVETANAAQQEAAIPQ
jgi:methyl-accepting chemotaxis protein